jgi:DNA-binding LacI/PurR family transcriptional regulator
VKNRPLSARTRDDRIRLVTSAGKPSNEKTPRVGIVDVARHAGVSIALVSLALNGKGRVSEKTRTRIRELADQLGYKPNKAAASLRSGNSRTIGFVLSASGDDEWEAQWAAMSGQILLGAVLSSNRRGYSVVVLPPNASPDSIAGLAGVIVSDSLNSDTTIQAASGFGIPVLTNDRIGDSAIAVNINNGFGEMTRAALDHLHSRGSLRPALLTEPLGLYSNERAEHEYLDWCGKHETEPIVARGRHDRSDLIERIDELLSRDCDSIYSFYEEGPRVLAHLRARGIRVPEDVALVAAAAYSGDENRAVGVSTTVYHPEHQVDEPLDVLFDVIEGKTTPPVTIETGWEFEIHDSS